jgi:hypothetical protein
MPWIFKKPEKMSPEEYREYLLFSMRIGSIRMRYHALIRSFFNAYDPSPAIREDEVDSDQN